MTGAFEDGGEGGTQALAARREKGRQRCQGRQKGKGRALAGS